MNFCHVFWHIQNLAPGITKWTCVPPVLHVQSACAPCVCLCLERAQKFFHRRHKQTCACPCCAPDIRGLPNWSQLHHKCGMCPSHHRASSSCASSLEFCCCNRNHTHHTWMVCFSCGAVQCVLKGYTPESKIKNEKINGIYFWFKGSSITTSFPHCSHLDFG